MQPENVRSILLNGNNTEILLFKAAIHFAELGLNVWYIAHEKLEEIPGNIEPPNKEILKLLTFLYLKDDQELVNNLSLAHTWHKTPHVIILSNFEKYSQQGNCRLNAFLSAVLLNAASSCARKHNSKVYLIISSCVCEQELVQLKRLYFPNVFCFCNDTQNDENFNCLIEVNSSEIAYKCATIFEMYLKVRKKIIILRISYNDYIGHLYLEIDAFCKKSKLRSCDNINEQQRQHLFENFWKNMNWEQQRSLITSHVNKIPKKITESPELSKRTDSRTYVFTIDNVGHKVCKKMYLATLGIKDWFVRYWLTKTDCAIPLELSTSTRNPEKIEDHKYVEKFLAGLPKMLSHYCCAKTSRKYLEPIFSNMTQHYHTYKVSVR